MNFDSEITALRTSVVPGHSQLQVSRLGRTELQGVATGLLNYGQGLVALLDRHMTGISLNSPV